MSGVTIKFWDIGCSGYISSESSDFFGLCVDQNGVVLDWDNDVMANLKPHFFKNGERIG